MRTTSVPRKKRKQVVVSCQLSLAQVTCTRNRGECYRMLRAFYSQLLVLIQIILPMSHKLSFLILLTLCISIFSRQNLPEIFLFVSLYLFREGNGNPLQYSCLENPMDGGAWQAAVHRVAKSRTRLKRLSSSSSK